MPYFGFPRSSNTSMPVESLDDSYTTLRVVAAAVMILLGGFGIFINGSMFFGIMSTKRSLGGFFTLCASKTISNTMICCTFVIWAVPCTILNYYFLPHQVNILFGQFGGWMPYIMGPFTQMCMSMNRFFALFLPHYFSRPYSIPVSLCAILLLWTISIVITALGVPVGCGFIFVIRHLAWEPEESECAVDFAVGYFYLIVATSVFTNTINGIIAAKLVMTATRNAFSQEVSDQRRKKRHRMFIQSVTQDTLHVMDTINCSIISHYSEAVWYRFVFSSLSFLGIHVFDGLVMILFNKQLRPSFMRPPETQVSHIEGKTSMVHKTKNALSTSS